MGSLWFANLYHIWQLPLFFGLELQIFPGGGFCFYIDFLVSGHSFKYGKIKYFFFEIKDRLLWTELCPQNSYIKVLTPNVTVFGDQVVIEVK